MTSLYEGECDCSARGTFEGEVEMAQGLHITATNLLGDSASILPVVAYNQLALTIVTGDTECMYACGTELGSLIGLPTESPTETSKTAVRARRVNRDRRVGALVESACVGGQVLFFDGFDSAASQPTGQRRSLGAKPPTLLCARKSLAIAGKSWVAQPRARQDQIAG
eukprot:3932528-Rhodomonas_salina.2